MRIGLVIEQFDPRRGGAENWTFQLASRLVALGHEVHVVAERFGARARDVDLIPHAFGPRRSRLARASAAEAILNGLDVDVIHDIGLGWSGHLLQSEDGSRLAQWEHLRRALPSAMRPAKQWLSQFLPRYQEFRALMRRQYGDPDRHFIAVSRMCARHFEQLHGVSADRIHVIYHGTDTAVYHPLHRRRWREVTRRDLGIHPGETVFLFVGNDYIRKGLTTAIRAVRHLAQDHAVRLLVVGARKPQGSKSRVARRRARPELYVGRVDHTVPYYAAADVFVLPTFYDPCSLSVGEAAASGLPIVTTPCNGAAELMTDGVEGFLLHDPRDDVALRTILKRLLDPQLRERQGVAARRLAERYTLERNCDQILSLYDRILFERGRYTIPFPSHGAAASPHGRVAGWRRAA